MGVLERLPGKQMERGRARQGWGAVVERQRATVVAGMLTRDALGGLVHNRGDGMARSWSGVLVEDLPWCCPGVRHRRPGGRRPLPREQANRGEREKRESREKKIDRV